MRLYNGKSFSWFLSSNVFRRIVIAATAGGFVCIESIKEGDEVYSCNADTGEIGLKKVLKTTVHEVTELVHLTIDDETIDTTREHPFFLEGLGFIAASELRAGDEIRLYDGSTGVVKSVEIEILENPVNVYNFEVEDWHTYYVGEEGALVHNWCGEDNGGSVSSEAFLPTEKTHDLARNTLIKELDDTGVFKNGSQKYYGRLMSSYGYGKQIGTQSIDGKVRWRLDYDGNIGVHYNIEDFSKGKGANAIKKVIPIDISYDEYKSIIDLWN